LWYFNPGAAAGEQLPAVDLKGLENPVLDWEIVL